MRTVLFVLFLPLSLSPYWVNLRIPQSRLMDSSLRARSRSPAMGNDLVRLFQDYALRHGYTWDESGANIVGIRQRDPAIFGRTPYNDTYLLIKRNRLLGIFFGSTEPGVRSYPGSEKYSGVAEIIPKQYIYSFRHINGQSILHPLGKMEAPRDINADGRINLRESKKMTPATGIWFHYGGEDRTAMHFDLMERRIRLGVVNKMVDNTSLGCQIILGNYYFDALRKQYTAFPSREIGPNSRFRGQDRTEGAFSRFMEPLRDEERINYILINAENISQHWRSVLHRHRLRARDSHLGREKEYFAKLFGQRIKQGWHVNAEFYSRGFVSTRKGMRSRSQAQRRELVRRAASIWRDLAYDQRRQDRFGMMKLNGSGGWNRSALLDGDISTAWKFHHRRLKGKTLEIEVRRPIDELEYTALLPGCFNNRSDYFDYGSIKRVRITHIGNTGGQQRLLSDRTLDFPRRPVIALEPIIDCAYPDDYYLQYDSIVLRIKILDIYYGEKYPLIACMAEVLPGAVPQ